MLKLGQMLKPDKTRNTPTFLEIEIMQAQDLHGVFFWMFAVPLSFSKELHVCMQASIRRRHEFIFLIVFAVSLYVAKNGVRAIAFIYLVY